MSDTLIEIDGIGMVEIVRHSTVTKLRLTFRRDGIPKVTIPRWAPFKAGVLFATKHRDWIVQHAPTRQARPLVQGQRIGKSGTLVFIEDSRRTAAISRIKQMSIAVTIPENSINTKDSQNTARKACERYLRTEAEQLLPGRLLQLAKRHAITYRSVSIKRLQARWGSCSSTKDIVLNYFLMELPWNLIDYVLLHELNHVTHMHHGAEFWTELERMLPDAKARKAEIKSYQPSL